MQTERIKQYQVFEQGKGLVIRIPPEFAEDRGIKKGTKVDWHIVFGEKSKAVLEFTENCDPIKNGDGEAEA